MNVLLGVKAIGTSGPLGHVQRFIFNARSQRVGHLVVKSGLLGHERIVPITCVTRTEPSEIHLDMDERTFEAMDDYTEEAYRAPDNDYIAPPSEQTGGRTGTDYQDDVLQALGDQAMSGGKPFGFPGGEQIVRDDEQLVVVAKGTPVFDVDGEKVGEVSDAGADPQSEALIQLAVHKGLLSGDAEVPLNLIEEIGVRGIRLSATKDEVLREAA